MIRSYDEAWNALSKINPSSQNQHVNLLKAFICYEQENLDECRECIDDCLIDDPDTLISEAALQCKEDKVGEASKRYIEALNIQGYRADIYYGLAYCHYSSGNFSEATTLIDEIIERSSKEYPELFVKGFDQQNIKSTENSKLLENSLLIESINLKAAIEYSSQHDSVEYAKKVFQMMPPRTDEELDAITLQNQAILYMDEDPNAGLQKLNFLLANPPFPVETFGNLLLLYCQQGHQELAADILAKNAHLTTSLLTKDLYDFLDASILLSTSIEEAYRKFNDLTKRGIDRLRKLNQSIRQARVASDNEKEHLNSIEFEKELERYVPILMAMAGIYWDKENYDRVESILQNSADVCRDSDTWKLNAAHAFFMSKESKFNEAISFYAPLLNNANNPDLLKIPAIVLANLCVSYIMTNQNSKAEDIIKAVEKAENFNQHENPEKRYHHGCIINLCIGTLYCEKQNFEFGISRICKSLEPIEEKLSPDTWYYCKRSFLAFAEAIAKNFVVITDESLDEILLLLDVVAKYGADIPSTTKRISITPVEECSQVMISSEAYTLRQFYSKLQ